MEFWGVEVKPGEPLKVQPEFGKLVHISQAALGEMKDGKGAKNIPLRLKIDNKNFIIGSLSSEDRTQVMFDLVFEREFELSHDWKNGSVYFIGYMAEEPASDVEEFSDGFDDESEDEPVEAKENGQIKPKSGDVKVAKSTFDAAAAAAKGKAGKKKEEGPESHEDDGDSESDDEMTVDAFQQEDSSDAEEDSEDDEGDSSEEDELPKAQQSKKRPAAEQKTPVAVKKAKAATPDKTGKKGQAATPVPSKLAGNKSKEQTPKSGGQLTCKSCTKTFTSANALQSHSKAKHGGK